MEYLGPMEGRCCHAPPMSFLLPAPPRRYQSAIARYRAIALSMYRQTFRLGIRNAFPMDSTGHDRHRTRPSCQRREGPPVSTLLQSVAVLNQRVPMSTVQLLQHPPFSPRSRPDQQGQVFAIKGGTSIKPVEVELLTTVGPRSRAPSAPSRCECDADQPWRAAHHRRSASQELRG